MVPSSLLAVGVWEVYELVARGAMIAWNRPSGT